LHHSDALSIQAERDILKKNCDLFAGAPAGAVVVERDGVVLVTVAECALVFGRKSSGTPPKTIQFDAPIPPGASYENPASIPQPPPGFVPDNFRDQQDALLREGTRIKNLRIHDLSNASVAAVIGLYGFAGGFGIWIFYRLVCFAVKG
jgi:hypothetical protein